jgi:diadenosine tetraphosphatase ApaH/serine/threonine PP2A family protein phosphatase
VIAVLYDIHGTLPALDAVLDDAAAAEVDAFILGGDYALFGPWPAESLARVGQLDGATIIRGNVDRWTAFPDDLPDDEVLRRAVADTREAIGAHAAEKLGALPEQVVVDGTRYCHASPVSDMRSFLPGPGEDDDELLSGVGERRIVFGHTHLQFRRTRPDGIELINPGSVGMPFDGDQRAAYALLHDDGSLELRRVAYDHDASAVAVVERFGDVDWATRSARRLREARP